MTFPGLMKIITLIIMLAPLINVTRAMELRFYDKTCPSAESTIYSIVQNHYNLDKSIAPNLIRLLLHDCFVGGCDASILLRSTPTNVAERDAEPNLSLTKSFELIDELKEAMESMCPRTVSCADLIAIASRDAVTLVGGQHFELLLGRHDGTMSKASYAMTMLPDLHVDDHNSLDIALQAFHAKGFTTQEFLALMGAHSVGMTACKFVNTRLSNYQGTRKADPSMKVALLKRLKGECNSNITKRVPFDVHGTSQPLGSTYFSGLLAGDGVLSLEAQLVHRSDIQPTLHHWAHNNFVFQTYFQHSFKKLGVLNVLTHTGQIARTHCGYVN